MTDSAKPPFAAKKPLEIKSRRMAYIDEGEGAHIVFAHGNPTSSYLQAQRHAGLSWPGPTESSSFRRPKKAT